MNQQPQPTPAFAQASDGARQVQIKATDEKLKGDYSNAANISYNKEEFWLDFLSVFPPTGTLNARVIVSPNHFKRMVRVMEESLKKYETSFGKIEEAGEPKASIGFGA